MHEFSETCKCSAHYENSSVSAGQLVSGWLTVARVSSSKHAQLTRSTHQRRRIRNATYRRLHHVIEYILYIIVVKHAATNLYRFSIFNLQHGIGPTSKRI